MATDPTKPRRHQCEQATDSRNNNSQDNRLLTPDDFSVWEANYADKLRAIEEDRRAVIQDRVIRYVKSLMKLGISKQDAGNLALRCWNYVDGLKRQDVKRALEAIGWTPPPVRSNGSDAA